MTGPAGSAAPPGLAARPMTPAELAATAARLQHAVAFFDRQTLSPRPGPTCKPGSTPSPPGRPPAPGAPMGAPIRPPAPATPDSELTATRRDLQTGIAMMRRGSPMHAPAAAYLAAVTAELDRRARHPAPDRPGPEPGTPKPAGSVPAATPGRGGDGNRAAPRRRVGTATSSPHPGNTGSRPHPPARLGGQAQAPVAAGASASRHLAARPPAPTASTRIPVHLCRRQATVFAETPHREHPPRRHCHPEPRPRRLPRHHPGPSSMISPEADPISTPEGPMAYRRSQRACGQDGYHPSVNVGTYTGSRRTDWTVLTLWWTRF